MDKKDKVFAGPRVRRIRREMGLSQSQMAAELGFSVSYINLVERDQRPVSAQFLLRLAEVYDLDLTSLAGNDEARAFEEIKEVMADPMFEGVRLSKIEIQDAASASPAIGEMLSKLYSAYRQSHERVTELSITYAGDSREAGDGASSGLPSDEVRDFLQGANNYFPELDEAAELLSNELCLKDGNVFAKLEARLLDESGIKVRVMPVEVLPDSLRVYDRHRRQLLISEMLSQSGKNFQLAYAIGMLEKRRMIDRAMDDHKFKSGEAERLARVSLNNYFAGAMLMPYGRFIKTASTMQYDIEHLAQRFDTSFEQTCHRLTTLQRPGNKGIPFFFIRVDSAGNVSKRHSSGRFHFARFGGTCPLWNLHECFTVPNKIFSQIIQMPDDTVYFSVARTVVRGIKPYGQPRQQLAIALTCDLAHAKQLVYTKGHDMERVEATPVGPNCRLCERPNCAQRALPPLTQRTITDERSRGFSAYRFTEE